MVEFEAMQLLSNAIVEMEPSKFLVTSVITDDQSKSGWVVGSKKILNYTFYKIENKIQWAT